MIKRVFVSNISTDITPEDIVGVYENIGPQASTSSYYGNSDIFKHVLNEYYIWFSELVGRLIISESPGVVGLVGFQTDEVDGIEDMFDYEFDYYAGEGSGTLVVEESIDLTQLVPTLITNNPALSHTITWLLESSTTFQNFNIIEHIAPVDGVGAFGNFDYGIYFTLQKKTGSITDDLISTNEQFYELSKLDENLVHNTLYEYRVGAFYDILEVGAEISEVSFPDALGTYVNIKDIPGFNDEPIYDEEEVQIGGGIEVQASYQGGYGYKHTDNDYYIWKVYNNTKDCWRVFSNNWDVQHLEHKSILNLQITPSTNRFQFNWIVFTVLPEDRSVNNVLSEYVINYGKADDDILYEYEENTRIDASPIVSAYCTLQPNGTWSGTLSIIKPNTVYRLLSKNGSGDNYISIEGKFYPESLELQTFPEIVISEELGYYLPIWIKQQGENLHTFEGLYSRTSSFFIVDEYSTDIYPDPPLDKFINILRPSAVGTYDGGYDVYKCYDTATSEDYFLWVEESGTSFSPQCVISKVLGDSTDAWTKPPDSNKTYEENMIGEWEGVGDFTGTITLSRQQDNEIQLSIDRNTTWSDWTPVTTRERFTPPHFIEQIGDIEVAYEEKETIPVQAPLVSGRGISSFEWFYRGEKIGEGANTTLSLPTGSHIVDLWVSNIDKGKAFTQGQINVKQQPLDLSVLVPEANRNNGIVLELLQAITTDDIPTDENKLDFSVLEWLRKIDELSLLQNPRTTSLVYLRLLGKLLSIKINNTLNESTARSLLSEAIDWYKEKGTYQSTSVLSIVNDLDIIFYDVYAKQDTNDTYDEQTYVDWFVGRVGSTGGVGTNPSGLDSDYIKTPHFGIIVQLNKYYDSLIHNNEVIETNHIWYPTYSNNVIEYVEKTRPIHTVPSYLLRLYGKANENGDVTLVPCRNNSTKGVRTKVFYWEPLSKYFDEIETESQWTFDQNDDTGVEDIYFDQNLYHHYVETFLNNITTWKIGVGNKNSCLEDSEEISTTQTITLTAGVNWVSFNVLPEDRSIVNVLADYVPSNDDEFRSYNESSTYFTGFGWFPTSMTIEFHKMYKITCAEAHTFYVEGSRATPTTPITLYAGYNWIGYPLQQNKSINDAFVNLQATVGDYIEDEQGNVSYYVTDGIWEDYVSELEAGKGYVLYVHQPHTFSFPDPVYAWDIQEETLSDNTVTHRITNTSVIFSFIIPKDSIIGYNGDDLTGVSELGLYHVQGGEETLVIGSTFSDIYKKTEQGLLVEIEIIRGK